MRTRKLRVRLARIVLSPSANRDVYSGIKNNDAGEGSVLAKMIDDAYVSTSIFDVIVTCIDLSVATAWGHVGVTNTDE